MKSKRPSLSYYEIRVEGELGDMWASWFENLSVQIDINAESRRPITVLCGAIPDQPALHSILNKIRDLNLNLLSVKKINTK